MGDEKEKENITEQEDIQPEQAENVEKAPSSTMLVLITKLYFSNASFKKNNAQTNIFLFRENEEETNKKSNIAKPKTVALPLTESEV